MKALAIFLLMPFLYFNAFAVPHSNYQRTKRENSNYSKYKYALSVNKTTMLTSTTTTTTTITTDSRITDNCNASSDFDSDSGRIRRSMQNILENITTTESPQATTIDLSILSPEFLSCPHVYVQPGCYQKLDNESVFVPIYDMLFNRSNYFIHEKLLFICAFFYDKLHYLNSRTTASSFIDPCQISDSSDSETERMRRSIESASGNITETSVEAEIDLSMFSPEFLNCTHLYLEPECYEKLADGTVFVPVYKKHFDKSNYLINDELLFICPDFFNTPTHESKFSNNYGLVSLICACISFACILLHMIMFVILKELRNLPGYCRFFLCVALVGAYICFFIQQENISHGLNLECRLIGMFLLYFYLASFFWMNVMAYDVWKSIRMATAKLRLTRNRPFIVQLARYSLYAWGTPLMISILSIIIHHSSPEDSKLRLTFQKYTCWFRYRTALTLYFAGPLFTLLIVNVLLFLSSFLMILNSSFSSKYQSKDNQRSSDLWSRLFLLLKLGSVMGFTWIFGFVASATKQGWLWYLYSIFSALQGVFIFFSFTVSERTRKAFLKRIRKRTNTVMPAPTTSQQGTSF